jgi:2-polyprenyl-6-methoxyphenol hydroxylase-like FAD-dependent oxidoreductase
MKILISGGSIAGPALALWLRRYGADVTVVEIAPSLREGGQLVDVRGIGRDVLKRMGIDEQVRSSTEANYGLSFVDSRNRTKGRFGADDFGGDGPVPEIEILRGTLSRVVVEHGGAGVDYRFGDRIVEFTQHTDGVDVVFTSGTKERFDLVFGADGLHSELRDRLFAPQAARVEHLGMYLALWTTDNYLNIDKWSLAYREPGRTIIVRSILDDTKLSTMVGFRGGPPSYDWRDIDSQKRITMARMSGMGWEAAQLLAQIETADDFYFHPVSMVKLDRWSHGRIALLGDAAYCASPQSGHGTTMAFVGAYILAGELAAAGGDHKKAFQRYEAQMRPWVTEIQAGTPSLGKYMVPETAAGVRLGNVLAQLISIMPGKALLARSMTNMASEISLRDYSQYSLSPSTPAA